MSISLRPSSLRQVLLAAALCGALAAPAVSHAAALGDASVRSSLGQPLEADIEFAALSAAEADSLAVRIAPQELFTEAGLDYTPLIRSMRVSVDRRGDRRLIHVSSDLPVNDPFVTLLIELNTNGSRLVRQYSLLIDPPAIETPGSLANSPAGAMPATPAAPSAPSAPSTPSAHSAPSASTAAPPAPAAAPAVPAADRATVTVRKGQTLRSIAAGLQPEGVRLEQVLVALQNANPRAFAGGNINRVMSGSVLQLPDQAAMRAIDPAAARRSLRAQTADFLRYRNALAERAARSPAVAATSGSEDAAANRSSSGRVGVQLEEPGSAAASRDRLALSPPGRGETAPAAPNPADALDRIATDKALADANARIAALEKSISDMQQLLAVQSPGSGAPTQAVDAAPEADKTPAETAAPAASGSPDEAPAASADAGIRPDMPAETGEPVPPPAAAEPAPVPAQPDVEETALPGALQDPRLAGALAGGLLLPLLGWLVWRRRRRSADAADGKPTALPPEDGNAVNQTVIAESGGRHVDTSNSVFHSNFVPSVSQIDAKEVDALAEADVYIAYGRDAQAEEILLDALRTHPDRHALRVKLLEIYAARRDQAKFDQLAAELRVLTHGQGEDWAQAARLGQLLEPGNRLYRGPARPEMPAAEPPASATVPQPQASPVDDFGLKLEGLLDERRKEAPLPPAAMHGQLPPPVPDFGLDGIGAAGERPARVEPTLDDGDTSSLTTKLELALACQEIGDREGARELLNEVAGAGNAQLAERAQSLLKQLA